jgi:hypothetical protein
MASTLRVGIVGEVLADGPRVVIPRRSPTAQFGPVASSVPDLVPGERVIVSGLDDQQDNWTIISRLYGRRPTVAEVTGLPEALAARDARLTALEGRASTTEGVDATQNGRLTAVEGRASSVEGRASALEGRATAIEGVNATQTTNIGTNTTALATLRTDTAGKVTAKGDLLAGTAVGVLARQPVGADGLALVGASGQATGLAYAEVRGIPNGNGLPGATAPTRYVGATAAGAPTTGTFLAGDFVISQDLQDVWVCVVGGTPGTWASSAAALRSRLFGGPTRTRPYHCIVRCTANFTTSANTDVWAQGGWTGHYDLDGMYGMDLVNGPNGNVNYSFIQIPVLPRGGEGLWDCTFRAVGNGQGNTNRLANKIAYALDVGQSIASDRSDYFSPSAAENYAYAQRLSAQLAAGTKLRWSTYCNVATMIYATQFGAVSTEIQVKYVGPAGS